MGPPRRVAKGGSVWSKARWAYGGNHGFAGFFLKGGTERAFEKYLDTHVEALDALTQAK